MHAGVSGQTHERMNVHTYIIAVMQSELAPYLDVIGILFQMLGKDGVDVAADSCVAVAEDAGDAFQLLPYAVLDVDRMTLHQL